MSSEPKTTMRLHLAACKAAGSDPAFFAVSHEVYAALSMGGHRPSTFEGVNLSVIDTWAWGWVLFHTKFKGDEPQAFEPCPPAGAGGNVVQLRS